jgi:hypothetical protein
MYSLHKRPMIGYRNMQKYLRTLVLVFSIAYTTPGWAQIDFPDFSSTTGLNMMGDATVSGTVLRLTPSVMDKWGGAWYNTKQYVQGGYFTRFQFQITDTNTQPGNGFTFSFQNDNATRNVNPAHGLNYELANGNILVGLCVEFRLSSVGGGLGVPKDNTISVHTWGPNVGGQNISDFSASIGSATPTTWMKDGNVHTVFIEYVPGTLTVFLDDSLTALLTVSVDFTSISGGSILDASDQTWVGFTGSTCGLGGNDGPTYETQDILNWSSSPTVKLKFTDDTLCYGSKVKLAPKITGGAKPLTYQWTPTAGLDSPAVANPSASPISTTTYSLTVTDKFGTSVTGSKKIFVMPLPVVDAGTSSILCEGVSGTLLGVAATSGLPPYTYAWTPATGLTSPTQLTTTYVASTTTTYFLRATDSRGCVGVDSVVVIVRKAPLLAGGANATLTICEGDTVTIGGPATGSPPFTYQWTPAAGLSATNIASPVASPKSNATYNIVVTDAFGCQNHGQVSIFVQPSPHPRIIAADTVICAGDTTVLTSTDTNYSSFRWSNGDTTRSTRVWKAGKYTVTAFVKSGCKMTSVPESITVLTRPPVPVITASGPTSFCEGGSVTLSVPAGNNQYRWSNGATTPTVNIFKSGVFTATSIASNGCTSMSQPVRVTMNPKPKPVITGPSITCIQSNSTYSVDDTVTNNYAWTVSPGGTLVSGAGTNTIVVRWTGAGTENLKVVETNPTTGCSDSATMMVTVSTVLKPKIGIRGDTVLCGGDSVVLDAGGGYGTYTWSSGAATRKITVTQPGYYFVHVADAGGCSGTSDTVHVTVGTSITAVISGPDTVCTNTRATYITSAVAGRTYSWTVTGGTIVSGSTSDTLVVQWGAAGTGTIDLVASSGACSGSATIAVSVGNGIVPAILANGPTTFCIGDSVTLSAPSGLASYQWSSGETVQSIVVKASGTFTVTAFDASGCGGTSAPTTVTVGSSLAPVIMGTLAFCPGDSTTLHAGAGYATYLWSTGATTEAIVVNTPGTFHVDVSLGNCSGTSQDVTVIQFPAPAPVITVNGTTLTATPAAATYQWSRNGTAVAGETQQSIIVTVSGSYTVQVTDANGCTGISPPYNFTAAAPTATVTVGTIPSVKPGTMVEIPIELTSSQDLVGNGSHYIGTMRYNGTMLIPTGSRGGTLGASSAVAGSSDRTVTFEGQSAAMSTGILQWIQCHALLGNDTCTNVILDTIYWTDAPVVATRGSNVFCENGICITGGNARFIDPSGSFAMRPGYPNPTTAAIEFDYGLIEAGQTQLVLSDALGRTVRVIEDGIQLPGHYTVKISTNDLQTGCYVCTLRTPSQVLRQFFLVRR